MKKDKIQINRQWISNTNSYWNYKNTLVLVEGEAPSLSLNGAGSQASVKLCVTKSICLC